MNMGIQIGASMGTLVHKVALVATPSRGSADGSSEDFAGISKSAVLITSSLVSSLIMLDSNIVAVSLPATGHSLNASFTDIQWVISTYVLTYAALLLASGDYADLRGRRHAMAAGLCIFAIASAARGAATTALIMDLARAVQGVGGALLVTASLAIISHEFTGAERARAFAFWGASLGIALAVGPIVGGAITNFFGWRWVFLVNDRGRPRHILCSRPCCGHGLCGRARTPGLRPDLYPDQRAGDRTRGADT
jgi:hypothetical protein